MFGPERGCLAVMWPLAMHPGNKNELLAWDLAHDPSELPSLDVATLRQRLFSKTAALPEGVKRLPLKSIHLNKSPMVVRKLQALGPALAAQWGVDIAGALVNAEKAVALPDMSAIWSEVFARPIAGLPDVDEDLYGGFIGAADRKRLNQLRALSGEELAHSRTGFDDDRLEELVFRYRARNFTSTLSPADAERWKAHRGARLLEGQGGARNVDTLLEEIDVLLAVANKRAEAILDALHDYAETIAPEMG